MTDPTLYPSTSLPPGPLPPPNPGKVIDSQITTDSITTSDSTTVTASDLTTVTASDLTTATFEVSGSPTVTKTLQSTDVSPVQEQTPVLDPFVSVSPDSSTGVSTSATTSTATTTTAAGTSDTSTTMSTPQGPVTSTVQVSSTSSQDPNLTSSINEPKGSPSPDDNQQISTYSPKPGGTYATIPVVTNSVFKNDNVYLIKKVDQGNSPVTTLNSRTQEKSNAQIQDPQPPLSISTSQDSAPTRSITGNTIVNDPQTPTKQMDQQIKRAANQHSDKRSDISAATDQNGDSVTASKDKTSSTTRDDSILRNNTNDNSNIIPEGFPPLTHIIPTLLVIMATITTFFLLYKYTPFGFLLGKKKKKKNLRRIIGIPEEPAYESIHKIAYEIEGHNLGGQIMENDIYTKLININRYKKAMKKKKKKKKITLIEVHMEVLEEFKYNEWELHKDDFLEICLQVFIHKENDIYSNFTNSELSVNNVKNKKTIQDIEK
ncbi:STP1 protein [Plasmodium ovale wallikeri]|uniref:STP1 protein n=1 Tax=Plasmodium ovale wallikeri TaxID=864142 RepID=A0A1A9AIG1_PLAOA|nr:STP1 protein [Plasmodium ovale wallikeri]